MFTISYLYNCICCNTVGAIQLLHYLKRLLCDMSGMTKAFYHSNIILRHMNMFESFDYFYGCEVLASHFMSFFLSGSCAI